MTHRAFGPPARAVLPLAQTWTLATVGQSMDAILNAAPGWTLPPIVTWSSTHMLVALLTCALLALASDTDGDGDGSAPVALLAMPGVRRLVIAALALLIGLLLGIVVLGQPAILLPALGLALTYRLWTTQLRPEARH